MSDNFQVHGTNDAAPFTLTLHRGDGMTLIAMNWRHGTPPKEFVGFAIEYREPGGDRYFALKNRLCFPEADGSVNPNKLSTLLSPIQKFRWVHFPRNAEMPGAFHYRVTPVFMNFFDELSYGESQEADIELRRETYPGKLNVTFTRGFVSSQAFVDRFAKGGGIAALIPANADAGLDFTPSHPKAKEALPWMGFEARSAIFEVLDAAIDDDKKAEVFVVAYDLSERDIYLRLKKLGKRLHIIIDNSDKHGLPQSAESVAAKRLKAAGAAVKRHHMSNLQHNKTIIVDGPKVKTVVCGSTNFTWRGLYVQANNALVLKGKKPVKVFRAAFDEYMNHDSVVGFGKTPPAKWADAGIASVNAKVAFSPHGPSNALLQSIADDIASAKSCLFYSLAFIHQTKGAIRDAVTAATNNKKVFVYGISDRKVRGGGIDVQKPDGNVSPVFAEALTKNLPQPFKREPTGLAAGNKGTRMHHKFVVLDFDKPNARVYLGSYNFSKPADVQNGENLLLIRDRRIVVSYTVEALRLFDHYHFRVVQREAKKARTKLALEKPPRKAGEKPWWDDDYTVPRKIRDRELFS